MKLFRATAPLESVAIDILGELIRTPRGQKYILVITDRFTKLVKAIPRKRMSAGEVAKLFVNHWVFNHGPPTELLSENGSKFSFRTSSAFWTLKRCLPQLTTCRSTEKPSDWMHEPRFIEIINRRPPAWLRSLHSWTHVRLQLSTTELNIDRTIRTTSAAGPEPISTDLPEPSFSTPREFKQKWNQLLAKPITDTQAQISTGTLQALLRKTSTHERRRNEARRPIYLRVERKTTSIRDKSSLGTSTIRIPWQKSTPNKRPPKLNAGIASATESFYHRWRRRTQIC